MDHVSGSGYTHHPEAGVQSEDSSEVNNEKIAYYYTSRDTDSHHGKVSDSPTEIQRELSRIPTCAVFHKIASGAGVPHTFVGFIRQWPALPRIVVCFEASFNAMLY